MTPFTIVLIHQSGERKTVPVLHVAPNVSYLSIRWDLSGTYDLNLRDNVLTASGETQPRGKARWYRKGRPLWKAEDILTVRKMARDAIVGETEVEAQKKAIASHEASMPGAVSAQGLQRAVINQVQSALSTKRSNPGIETVYDELAEEYSRIEEYPRYSGDEEP